MASKKIVSSTLHACELSQRVHHRFDGMQDKA